MVYVINRTRYLKLYSSEFSARFVSLEGTPPAPCLLAARLNVGFESPQVPLPPLCNEAHHVCSLFDDPLGGHTPTGAIILDLAVESTLSSSDFMVDVSICYVSG